MEILELIEACLVLYVACRFGFFLVIFIPKTFPGLGLFESLFLVTFILAACAVFYETIRNPQNRNR